MKTPVVLPRSTSRPSIVALSRTFAWHDSFSGYHQLYNASLDDVFDVTILTVPQVYRRHRLQNYAHYLPRLYQKTFQRLGLAPFYRGMESFHAQSIALQAARERASAGLLHVAYGEHDLGFRLNHGRQSFRLVATLHHDLSLWLSIDPTLSILRKTDGLIVLHSQAAAELQACGIHHAVFIPHGVDCEAFHPGSEKHAPPNALTCLVVGTWQRDFSLLSAVIRRAEERKLDIQFRILNDLNSPAVHELHSRCRNVELFEHVSSRQLRALYRSSSVLLFPLYTMTASNTLLEAIASGLPVVASNLPAIRDYTRPSFAQLCSSRDPDEWLSEIAHFADTSRRQAAQRAARAFAEQSLSWSVVREQTRLAFQNILGMSPPASHRQKSAS